jgi:hypothetical protein
MISSVCLARARGKELFTVASFCIVPWEGSIHQDEEGEIVIATLRNTILNSAGMGEKKARGKELIL